MEIKCNSCLHSCVCGMKQTYIETANSMDKLLDEGSNFGVQLICRFYTQASTSSYTTRIGANSDTTFRNTIPELSD